MSSRWAEMPTMYIDCETTGLDTSTARIWELGVLFRNSQLEGMERESLINPGIEIPKEIREKCGLEPSDINAISKAQSFDDSWSPLRKHIVARVGSRGHILVGHNILDYDWPLIQAEMDRVRPGASNSYRSVFVLDTLLLARRLLARIPIKKKLAVVAAHCGIATEGAHRAVADCLMVEGILTAMAPDLPEDLGGLLRWQGVAYRQQRKDWDHYKWWIATDVETGELLINCGRSIGRPLHEAGGFINWALTKSDLPPAARAAFKEALGR